MDKITTGGQGPKMGRSKDLYRYSVRRAAKMGAYVYKAASGGLGGTPLSVWHTPPWVRSHAASTSHVCP